MIIKRTTQEDLNYWQERLNELNQKLDALFFLKENSPVSKDTIDRWREQLQQEKQTIVELYARDLYKVMYPLKWPFSLLYKKEED